MKKDECFALVDEHNALLNEGTKLYQKLERDGLRIESIRDELRKAGIRFDEISLIFGAELDVVCGWEDQEEK